MTVGDKRIFLSPPDMTGLESQYLNEAFASNWIAPLGPFVDRFERDFATYVQVDAALALSSGTAALHLALVALDIGRGDTVICSDLTFVASANPILYVGAEPIFIDSESMTWNMDPNLLEEELVRCKKAGKLPKAVIIVHILGQSAEIKKIVKICNSFGVPLIEDAAESLGATYQGQHTGTFGDIGIFSFNGNKIITTSGGGMMIAKDKNLLNKCRYLSTQARLDEPHYEHADVGYNYRLSNLLAAVGVGQLEQIENKVSKRRKIFDFYKNRLGITNAFEFQSEYPESRGNRWLTALKIKSSQKINRFNIANAANNANIETRPMWKPMHAQPLFKDCRFVGSGISLSIFENGICLPSGSSLSESDQIKISDLIIKLI